MTHLSEERSYHFADFIRFVAIAAIIFQHSFIVERVILFTDFPSTHVYYSLKVIAKIGSISFFLVSGFLLSSALARYSSKEYLNKRVKNIFKPYVLFVFIYLILDSAGAFFGQYTITSLADLPAYVGYKLFNILFFTNYWFIFNYFISVILLLVLRRYLYNKWLGIFLFCCTLFYSVNGYIGLFAPQHTAAFIGFTFFLWLGANIQKQELIFWDLIDRTPYWKLIVIVAVALWANLYETYYFIGLDAIVVDSSLKASNIVYVLCLFLLLSKIGRNVKFTFLKPRDETYPLYLIHPIFVKIIFYGVLPMMPAVRDAVTIATPAKLYWPTVVLYHLVWFVVVYAVSLVAVRLILVSPFRWIFGKQGKVAVSPRTFEIEGTKKLSHNL
jgi:probable poly-beta-1,6-N-acetyl-D-glucosamine export protein